MNISYYGNGTMYESKINSYEEGLSFIRKIARFLKYSEDIMAIISADDPDEFDKIPYMHDDYEQERNLDKAIDWSICMDLHCIPFMETVTYQIGKNMSETYAIDRYDKSNIIKKGDIVYYAPSRNYFIAQKDLNDDNTEFSLIGVDEPFTRFPCSMLPFRYIRKASEYEIESLNLREILGGLLDKYFECKDRDEYWDLLGEYEEKYPWLK